MNDNTSRDRRLAGKKAFNMQVQGASCFKTACIFTLKHANRMASN